MLERNESIVIQPLANGYRVDVLSSHPGETRQIRIGEPAHYREYRHARGLAEHFHKCTGIPIIDRTREAGNDPS